MRGNNMFSSRELGLIGLAISFIGTLGMLWGGLESFIVVKTKTDPSDTEIVTCGGDGACHRDIEYKVVIPDIAGANWRTRVNRIGKGALAVGLFLQFIALYIDP
jgi:hypothetical protein